MVESVIPFEAPRLHCMGRFVTGFRSRHHSLYPDDFYLSYTGEALDYKTPLLKHWAAVDKAATEVCQLFDKNYHQVYSPIWVGNRNIFG